MQRNEACRDLWREIYAGLTADVRGKLGNVTSRAEAQVTRLSLLYALMDQAETIEAPHLSAAYAFWDYAFQSARWAFGSEPFSPNAQRILDYLEDNHEVTLGDINSRVYSRHCSRQKITDALREISELITLTKRQTAGRPAIVVRRKAP